MQLDDILDQLRQERNRIQQAISALESMDGASGRAEPARRGPGRPPKSAQSSTSSPKTATAKKRVLSPEARKRMAEAAKRRWANAKKGK